jgi:hypothetical protein
MDILDFEPLRRLRLFPNDTLNTISQIRQESDNEISEAKMEIMFESHEILKDQTIENIEVYV